MADTIAMDIIFTGKEREVLRERLANLVMQAEALRDIDATMELTFWDQARDTIIVEPDPCHRCKYTETSTGERCDDQPCVGKKEYNRCRAARKVE